MDVKDSLGGLKMKVDSYGEFKEPRRETVKTSQHSASEEHGRITTFANKDKGLLRPVTATQDF